MDSNVSEPAAEALAYLSAGHQRFLETAEPRNNAARRGQLAASQQPRAVVLCCSDSRVAPEIVYDCGLGELFVVRNAGNLLDDLVLGSIEFAVEQLAVPLILVVGHDHCGAVTAAVNGDEAQGHLRNIITRLQQAVAETRGQAGDPVRNGVEANVRAVVSRLQHEPHLQDYLRAGRVRVVGQRYNTADGTLTTL